MLVPSPNGLNPLSTLKPKTQGIESTIIKIVQQRSFLTTPAPEIHTKGNYVFKYGYNRRVCSKCHKDKEQSTPDPPCTHRVEDIGQGYKYKARTLARVNSKGKGGWENYKPCNNGDRGIQ